jgi:hypothetical protein
MIFAEQLQAARAAFNLAATNTRSTPGHRNRQTRAVQNLAIHPAMKTLKIEPSLHNLLKRKALELDQTITVVANKIIADHFKTKPTKP